MCKERLYNRRRFSEDELILMFRSLIAPGVILCAGLALLALRHMNSLTSSCPE
jgi:hypothetical protein